MLYCYGYEHPLKTIYYFFSGEDLVLIAYKYVDIAASWTWKVYLVVEVPVWPFDVAAPGMFSYSLWLTSQSLLVWIDALGVFDVRWKNVMLICIEV